MREMYFYCLLIIFNLLSNATNSFSSCRQSSSTCLYTNVLPINTSENCQRDFCMPSIGNGFVGTFIMSDTINVAGLYNGRANVISVESAKFRYGVTPDFFYNHTHRARIPSTIAINFTVAADGKREFALDVQYGIFYQWFSTKDIKIEQRFYAHRFYRNVLVNEIEVESKVDFTMALKSNFGNSSLDINFNELVNDTICQVHDCKLVIGETNEAEYENVERVNVVVVSTPIPQTLAVTRSSQTHIFRFLTVIATSMEKTEPVATATTLWLNAKADKFLLTRHKNEWATLWQAGNITVGEDVILSQIIYSSLYNILSSIRSDWIYGLSPGNLAGGEEYLGHVFWDQDIWMYPPVLMLFPDLAKVMQLYRYNRLQAAEMIAKKYGYEGVMFPWESGVSGLEVCPYEVYGKHELHVTGDVAFAAHQYYTATGDTDWLQRYGYELIKKAVEFWMSRSSRRNGKLVIDDVMPPDEYQYPVNNSFYTNVLAKLNVAHLIQYSILLNKPIQTKWQAFANELFEPYEKEFDYHPEFEGYKRGTMVKQADVILTNFPLMIWMNESTVKNDLEYYDSVTDPNGPAMTHSMFTVGWLQIGKNHKAEESFQKNFDQINGPFRIWSEISFGRGARNFITGAGGFLQSILFGYGGLRLKSDGLYFKLQIPPGSNQLQINGVAYKNCKICFYRKNKLCFVELVKINNDNGELYIDSSGYKTELILGKPVKLCNGRIYVSSTF